MVAWQFGAIGTAWQIDTREPLAPDVQAQVLDLIEHACDRLLIEAKGRL